jgi:hypothetical protein
MEQIKRKINWLWNRRIITTRYPINDKPTSTYNWGWFYEDGTYECYELFKNDHKINTFKSYNWHISVIKHINELSYEDFYDACMFIRNRVNGFTTVDIPKEGAEKMILNTYNFKHADAPPNKLRKIIFKIGCGLEMHEKRSIIGQLIGRGGRITSDDIVNCIKYIHYSGYKVTITNISSDMNCSRPTIYSVMTDDIKQEMDRLNLIHSHEKLQRKDIQSIQEGRKAMSIQSKRMDGLYKRRVDSEVLTDG